MFITRVERTDDVGQNPDGAPLALRAPVLSKFELGRALRGMEWKFFFGAAMLVVALLGPWAPIPDVLGGIALAAVIKWKLTDRGVS